MTAALVPHCSKTAPLIAKVFSMPSNRTWIGGTTLAVQQVADSTHGTYDTASTRTITVNNVTISAADSGGTLANALTALAVLLNASVHPAFSGITWSSSSTKIIGTADVAGVPFVFAASVSGGTGTVSSAFAITTANAGPTSFNPATNWSGATLPVDGDTIIFDGTSSWPLLYNLDQSSLHFAAIRIDMPEAQVIGLGNTFCSDVLGVTYPTDAYGKTMPEYRQAYFKTGDTGQAQAVTIGREFGPNASTGIGRIKLDLSDTNASVDIYNSAAQATSDDAGFCPIQLLVSNASYAPIYLRKGLVTFGGKGETVAMLACTVADTSAFSRVVFGTATGCTTFTQNGGINTIVTTTSQVIVVNGGTLYIEGTTTISSLTINGGTVYLNGALTCTACTIGNNAVLDATRSGRANTITTLTMKKGAKIVKDGTLTITNALAVNPTTDLITLAVN